MNEYRILAKTNGMSHEVWVHYRKIGIGGSDTGVMLLRKY